MNYNKKCCIMCEDTDKLQPSPNTFTVIDNAYEDGQFTVNKDELICQSCSFYIAGKLAIGAIKYDTK